jgi:hypothetical protein
MCNNKFENMFGFSHNEMIRVRAFMRRHDRSCERKDALGEQYTYQFTPTCFCTAKHVICNVCHAKSDVTEYEGL